MNDRAFPETTRVLTFLERRSKSSEIYTTINFQWSLDFVILSCRKLMVMFWEVFEKGSSGVCATTHTESHWRRLKDPNIYLDHTRAKEIMWVSSMGKRWKLTPFVLRWEIFSELLLRDGHSIINNKECFDQAHLHSPMEVSQCREMKLHLINHHRQELPKDNTMSCYPYRSLKQSDELISTKYEFRKWNRL